MPRRLHPEIICSSLAAMLMVCSLSTTAWALDPDDPAFVGVWLFDEGEGDVVADEANDNEGFLLFEDDFEWEAGKFNGAIAAFGGGSIDVEDSDSLATIDEGLTVAAWFRVDADSDTGVRKNGAFLLEDQSGGEPVPDGFSFRIWTDQGLSPGFYGQTELEQGEWYHIAGTYDSDSEVMELYINGEPESEIGALSDQNAEWEPVWGGLVEPGSPLQLKFGSESYTGAIDEVIILNRALSQGEVQELMSGWDSLGNSNPGDINGDGVCDAADIDALAMAVMAGDMDAKLDLNGDGTVDLGDHTFLIKDIKNTWVGDANLDGEFNSGDFVVVFTAGLYDTGGEAGWAAGDWNGDKLFNSSDFVAAFTDGGYNKGPVPAAAAVPEPSSLALLFVGLVACAIARFRK